MQQTKIGLVVLLLCLIQFTTASAQYDRRGYTLTADSDTVYWEKYIKTNEVKYGLEPIRTSTADYSFRLSSAEHTVAVYRNDTVVHGFITIFTSELKNLHPTDNHFKMTFALTPEQARSIMQIIEDAAISSVPSYNNITGWAKGTIGGVYILEQKSGGYYSFKSYWTPESQAGVREADLFNAFTYHFKKISDLPELFLTFNKAVPFKVWKFGNMPFMRVTDKMKIKRNKGSKLIRTDAG